MIVFVLIFSFLLQGILSLYLPFDGNTFHIFSYNFVLIALIVLYPIFYKKRQVKWYYGVCILYGFIYDLVYTNTLVIDSLLFFMIGLFVKTLYLKLADNVLNLFLIVFISNFVYDAVFYLLLVLFNDLSFYALDLVYRCVGSILLNFLYSFLLYKLVSKYKDKIKPSIYT